jgi:hypothetical protein
MSIRNALLGFALAAGLLCLARSAEARKPADDFISPQPGGPRLTLMPFIGPGFRANYDHRFPIEQDMSEVRTQLIGDVALPFSEVSANVDVRFFLNSLGLSVGFHHEWHLLQFEPDKTTGRDRAGETVLSDEAGRPLGPTEDPTPGYLDLHRTARAVKDKNTDIKTDSWPYFEGRWGLVTPADPFMGVSNLALRYENRPDVTYDWVNATVLNGGWHLRWEVYTLLRSRRWGFIGPAFRAMYVQRNRARGPVADRTLESGVTVPTDSACQAGQRIRCIGTYEFEFQYGILAGTRPSWVSSSDTFLIRAYTTWGLDNDLMGTHTFRQPLQILVAYMVDIDL